MKKKILLAVGISDQITRQVPGARENFLTLSRSPHIGKFDVMVFVGKSGDTYKEIEGAFDFRPGQTLFMTVPNSTDAFGFESLLKIGLAEGGFIHEKAEMFDFLFPSNQYEVTVAGNDFSGVFQSLFPQLKEFGYPISVYRDANKPISGESVRIMKSVGPTYFFASESNRPAKKRAQAR